MRDTKLRKWPKTHGIVIPQTLTVGVLSSAIAFLGFRQFNNAGTVSVVVAAAPLAVGKVLEETDVRVAKISKGAAPAKPIPNPEQVFGKTIQQPAAVDQPLSVEHFLAPRKSGFAEYIPSGHVMVPLSLHNRTLPRQGLMMGDRIDVLVTYPITLADGQKTKRTKLMAKNLLVLGYSGIRTTQEAAQSADALGLNIAELTSPMEPRSRGTEPTQLLLAVESSDVIKIAQIDDEPSYDVNIVLHGKVGVPVEIEAPEYPKPKQIEVIHGSKSVYVTVEK